MCFCRPFERTLTLQKDSVGNVGFVFKDNEITAIVKDSSAARNGVLTDHHLLEVDGQNVVGLKVRVSLLVWKSALPSACSAGCIAVHLY